ncbi:MAG: hypothetical protein IPM18_03890 [Phycisphaerales bacterium]|nr:hypothetical protein [Phycisphaerales bacterium]
MSTDWKVPRRSDVTTACEHVVQIGESFEACLMATETGYERRDFCVNCTCRPAGGAEPLARWRARRPEPGHRRVQPFDWEATYGFFERLASATDPQQLQFRFVLALLLWRKRILKFECSRATPDGELWEFITVRSGVVHQVVHPALDEAQLDRLSEQLEDLLSGQPAALGEPGESGDRVIAPATEGHDDERA